MENHYVLSCQKMPDLLQLEIVLLHQSRGYFGLFYYGLFHFGEMPNFSEASMAVSNPNSFALEAFPYLRSGFNCSFRVCRRDSWNFNCGFASGRFAKLSVCGLNGRWLSRGSINVSSAKGVVLRHGTQPS